MAVNDVRLIVIVCFVQVLTSNGVSAQVCDGVTSTVDGGQARRLSSQELSQPTSTILETAPREGQHDLHLGNCDELSEYFYDVIRCDEALANDTIYSITQYRFDSSLFIYCVNVTDLIEDDTGGYPMRYEGGLLQSFIDILFMSQLSQGMKFNVQVYAKSRN